MANTSWFKTNCRNIHIYSSLFLFVSMLEFIFLSVRNSIYSTLGFYGFVFSLCSLCILPTIIEHPKFRLKILELEWKYFQVLFPSYLIIISFLLVLNMASIQAYKSTLYIPSFIAVFGTLAGFLFTILKFCKEVIKQFQSNISKQNVEREDLSIAFYFIMTYLFGLFLASIIFFIMPVIALVHWIFI